MDYYEMTVRFVADDEQAGKLADAIYDLAGAMVDNVTVDDPELQDDDRDNPVPDWREFEFTPFVADENTGQPPEGTVYLFNMRDGTAFTDKDERRFTKVSDGPQQGACVVRQGDFFAHWAGDQIFRPVDVEAD